MSLLQNSEPVAASEDKVLVKFEDEIHCEILKEIMKRKKVLKMSFVTLLINQSKLWVFQLINGCKCEVTI